jgi:hypothetical protein
LDVGYCIELNFNRKYFGFFVHQIGLDPHFRLPNELLDIVNMVPDTRTRYYIKITNLPDFCGSMIAGDGHVNGRLGGGQLEAQVIRSQAGGSNSVPHCAHISTHLY